MILIPIATKPIAATTFKILLGIIEAIAPPAITPSMLARTRAVEAPRKTASGLLEAPLNATVAS